MIKILTRKMQTYRKGEGRGTGYVERMAILAGDVGPADRHLSRLKGEQGTAQLWGCKGQKYAVERTIKVQLSWQAKRSGSELRDLSPKVMGLCLQTN
jgi:hypothetical protein